MLHISEEFSGLTINDASKFADWVGEDGVMALKLISSNSSDLIVSDVTCHMWRRSQQETGTSQPAHAYRSPEEAPVQHAQPVYQSVEVETKLE